MIILIFKLITFGFIKYFKLIFLDFITNHDDFQTDQKLQLCFINDFLIKLFNFINYWLNALVFLCHNNFKFILLETHDNYFIKWSYSKIYLSMISSTKNYYLTYL
jgi:hypothetical protein